MLYFVATPIGNLQDFSFRAVEVLKNVEVIACEDTRHSKILLDKYNIETKTIAYHKFNEKNSANGIINLLKSGKSVAVISDAGMPVISDPGNLLTTLLNENNLPFTVIPGANAGLCALILSGFDASKFAFFGFLSEKNKELKTQLEEIKNFNGSVILYSSKHNINKDLLNLNAYLGSKRVAIVSEITKLHENTVITELPYQLKEPKGEYVLVIDNKIEQPIKPTNSQLLLELKTLLQSISKNEAFKTLQAKYSLTKSYIYNLYEKNK